ncbi:hypothetical protein BSL78_10158 [Apostichopus japonicus]|uniref:SAM domain-containing protein n=1 Tax=Stichopus japonicus TaxID=307972 RepID=A0A2G8KYB1_STIJA|nr:hypothetical protein BSL78_10158 [Apostichopus japonicus]
MEATKSSIVVSQFLENIGLAELKPQFEAHRIDDEVFELLDDESITQIIPKLGLRLKFKHHYNLRCNSLSEGVNLAQYLTQFDGRTQPFVLILGGNYCQPQQLFVIIERKAMVVDTLIAAIDLCYKAYQILDLCYPPQAMGV